MTHGSSNGAGATIRFTVSAEVRTPFISPRCAVTNSQLAVLRNAGLQPSITPLSPLRDLLRNGGKQ
jgi:hypothetical protein